jgi:hypothetical protein
MIYVRDLTLSQYEVVVSFISQRVSEYRKKIVNSAKEYAPLSTAKYAAKYAGSSALYNLLKDSRQVNFDTDILDIYGMSPENYMNVRDKQANIPGGDALGARGSSAAMGGLESDKLETINVAHIPLKRNRELVPVPSPVQWMPALYFPLFHLRMRKFYIVLYALIMRDYI